MDSLLLLHGVSIIQDETYPQPVLLRAPAFLFLSMDRDPFSPVTKVELRWSIFAFSLLAGMLSIPLMRLRPMDLFSPSRLELLGATALFWGSLSLLAFHFFWENYYQYIYPDRLRPLAVLNSLLYGIIAWTILLLMDLIGQYSVLVFLFLGGIEGVIEHVIAIYMLGVMKKVPWLYGLRTLPVLLFSFVEYVTLWGLVLWIAFGLRAFIQVP